MLREKHLVRVRDDDLAVGDPHRDGRLRHGIRINYAERRVGDVMAQQLFDLL